MKSLIRREGRLYLRAIDHFVIGITARWMKVVQSPDHEGRSARFSEPQETTMTNGMNTPASTEQFRELTADELEAVSGGRDYNLGFGIHLFNMGNYWNVYTDCGNGLKGACWA